MRTKQRTEMGCGRRAVLAELGIGEAADAARGTAIGRSQYSCRCPGCADAQWDVQRLKYWLCARLVEFGADEAEVDQRIGGNLVDVRWRRGDRWYAIEVRSGALECTLAREHTDRLRAAGCAGVLWLCPPGYWVRHLPALGVADLGPDACDYLIDTGMLDTDQRGPAAPRRTPFELREFLRGWVSGDIVWGYRDENTGGWARVIDWEQHTRSQATIIARQRQELVNQRTALAVSRTLVRDKQKQIAKLHWRLDRAEQKAQEQADAVAAVNRTLAERHRVEDSLRATIKGLNRTIEHWQLITICAMLLIVTFLAAAMIVR